MVGLTGLNPTVQKPGWILPGAICDVDYLNSRSYGAPNIWANQSNPTVGSVAMEGANFQAAYLPDSTGLWVNYASGGTFTVPGRGRAAFGYCLFPWLRNCDATNAAWTKSNMTTARSTGPDNVANSGSRLTATANGATITQAVTLASAVTLGWVVIKRVTGSGNISISVDGGSTNTVIPVTSAWQALAIPQQTLANPSFVLTMATSGDVVDVMWMGGTQGASGNACPKVPGVALTNAGSNTTFFGIFGEINQGRSGGGYANGSFGERWITAMNSGQAAIYVQFSGTAPSGSGNVVATDGPAFVNGYLAGSPVQFNGGVASSNNATTGTNRVMEGYFGAPTAGGNGQIIGCLNGGPITAQTSSISALATTHMVLGSQGSQALVLDGYIERVALFDHVPAKTAFVDWTTAPA